MGWLYKKGQTKQELVEHLVEPYSADNRCGTCLAHSLRGNVLWSVWEIVYSDGTVERYIGCDLLSKERNYGWGYEGMAECEGPYYWSCPLKFLDMVPMDKYPGNVSTKWRAEVYAQAAERKERAAKNRRIDVGSTLTLKEACNPRRFQVVGIRQTGKTGRGRRIIGVELFERQDGSTGAGHVFTIPKKWIEKVEGPTLPQEELPQLCRTSPYA